MSFNLDDYEPVDERLAKFWAENKTGRVITDLVSYGDGEYVVRAEVWRDAGQERPDASGYAQELVTAKGVNSTSALENCETSAIGRALANLGYAAKGKRPSREEMAKTQRETPGSLRVRIAQLGAARNKTNAELADDFASWSEGVRIGETEDVVLLARYIEYLKGPDDGSSRGTDPPGESRTPTDPATPDTSAAAEPRRTSGGRTATRTRR